MAFRTAPYDLSDVKAHETLHSSEVLVRIVAALAVLVIGFWWPQLPWPQLAAWAFVYIVAVLIIVAVARHITERATLSWVLLMRTLYVLECGSFIALPIYLWTFGTDIFLAFSLAFWAGLMMHILGFGEIVKERRGIVVPLVGVQGAFYVGWWAWLGYDPISYISLGAGFLVVYCYFLFCTYRLVHIRAQNAELTRNRIAAERSAAIGTLTGGVAHDFNNLLTVVLGNLELTREVSNAAERQELVEEAYRAAQRGANLTSDLLSFSRKDVLSPRVVDLNDAITSVAEFVRRVIPSQVRIEYRLSSQDLPRPMIDLTKFETMLLNLVVNARDAMPNGGFLQISTDQTEDGRWVILQIRDTGEGIPEHILPRVTDPFFTTKPHGKGTGLGLSMARGFVEQSGGHFEVGSQVGQGTWITIRLPNSHQAAPVSERCPQPSLRSSSTMLRMPSSGT